MTKFTARGIKLNKNGAIIVNTIGNTHHKDVLNNEEIHFRSPKKVKSYSDAQLTSRASNVSQADTRKRSEAIRVSSKSHIEAKAKRK